MSKSLGNRENPIYITDGNDEFSIFDLFKIIGFCCIPIFFLLTKKTTWIILIPLMFFYYLSNPEQQSAPSNYQPEVNTTPAYVTPAPQHVQPVVTPTPAKKSWVTCIHGQKCTFSDY